ncbi:hypothetical protein GCM10011521_18220 [Arenimonas soli]|uniref:Sel1 repeat family protein n=1 Tax=Arenimonas soli TaxID=2269504 RepID=A0ABQ1HJ80_9GAMM|nr:sel1 repeat family protein [Arenimonas soli]GGA80305.1 hypothetical protein GCM10011521_18220 [Arenimonas soli]
MALFAALALASGLALATAPALARPSPDDQRLVAQSDLFLQAHPDLHMRLRGLDKLDKGELDGAIEDFREAARHSDKPAQAILAELHWTGRGVPRDRGLAYVWMDLAAERGYPLMVAKREQYWRELEPDERETALAHGEDFYDQFGDAVARPRLEVLMKRAKINFRRSRAHSAGVDGVNVLVGDKFHRIRGRLFHDEKFWTPEGYFAWQDDLGHGRGEGRVDVGEVEQLPGN